MGKHDGTFRLITDVKHELAYAKADNILGRVIYDPPPPVMLRSPCVKSLTSANQIAKRFGRELLILDAWRPTWVQELLWNEIQDERLVAKPIKTNGIWIACSNHCRGTAIDITLVDGDMPSEYDVLSDEETPDSLLLHEIMVSCGWVADPLEWWHFDWSEAGLFGIEEHPVLSN